MIKKYIIVLELLLFSILLGCSKSKNEFHNKITNYVKQENGVFCDIELIEMQKFNILIYKITNNTDDNIIIQKCSKYPFQTKWINNEFIYYDKFYSSNYGLPSDDGEVELTSYRDSISTKYESLIVDSVWKLDINYRTKYSLIETRILDSLLNNLNDNDSKFQNVYISAFFNNVIIIEKNEFYFNCNFLKKEFPDSSLYKVFHKYLDMDYYDTLELQCIPNGIKGYKIWRDTIYTDTLIMGNIEF